jgi:hypothetical protein
MGLRSGVSASGGLELCRFTYKIANYSDMSVDEVKDYFHPFFVPA